MNRAMLIARTLQDLAAARAQVLTALGPIALVPTMGALHAGHIALLAHAREACPAVAVSIFVNPTQFGPGEDFARYPRQEEQDLARLRDAGCDLVWMPHADIMYPPGDATTIDVAGPAQGWEGAARPGHFRGVATVVTKLFGQMRPHAAVFGEKDWQQLQVIRRFTADLSLPVEIRAAPIVREPDGLAMSSRNRFLTTAERAVAPRLYAALCALRAAPEMAQGLRAARASLAEAGFAVDYLAVVDGATLRQCDPPEDNARVIAAVRLGSVRLLDNVPLR
jgi:pantoate--beta-alanine ligase